MTEELKAYLESLGLTPEQIAQVETDGVLLHTADAEDALEEGYKKEDGTFDLTKIKHPEFKAIVDDIVNQRDEALGQAESAKGEVTAAKADAEAAKGEAAQAKADLEGAKKDAAIKSAIKDTNVHDPEGIFKFLDLEKITASADGKVEGLTEQLDELKKTKAYLFKDDTKPNGDNKGGGINPADTKKTGSYVPGKMSFQQMLDAHENN